MKNSSMLCDSDTTSTEPDAITFTIVAQGIIGRALTNTLKSFSTEFLKNESLLVLIFSYVFENAPNKEVLESTLTRLSKKIKPFPEENLEILLLSLTGARMIVQEKKQSLKEFDEYMVAKKFKVTNRVLAYQENRKKQQSSKLAIVSRNLLQKHRKNTPKP